MLNLVWREDAGCLCRRPGPARLRLDPDRERGQATGRPDRAGLAAARAEGPAGHPQGRPGPRRPRSTPVYRPGLSSEDSPALRDQRVLIVEDEVVAWPWS
ncbi:hypothetical protein ACRAWD_28135 [Caulobacter segnis]